MKAEKTIVNIPVGNGSFIQAYQVDYLNYQIVGYHEAVLSKGTFGVYEHEAVADYVVDGIRNGSIKPRQIEIDHSYDED